MLQRFRAWLSAAILVVAAAPAAAEVRTWTGAGDGFRWNDGRNWSPLPDGQFVRPTESDDVIIPPGAGAITMSLVVRVRSLSLSRTMALGADMVLLGSGLTLATGGSLEIPGGRTLFLSSGGAQAIDGSGDIILGGRINVDAPNGVLSIAPGIRVRSRAGTQGALFAAAGAQVINRGEFVSAAGSLWTGSGFRNEGRILATDAGSVGVNATSLSGQGEMHASGAAARIDLSGTYNADAIGSIRQSNGGQVRLSGTVSGGTLRTVDGTGLVTVPRFPLSFADVTVGVPLTVGDSLTVLGSGMTLQPGAPITLQGSLRFEGRGPQLLGGAGEIVGAATSVSGAGTTLTIGEGVTLRSCTHVWAISPNTAIVNNGTISAPGAPRHCSVHAADGASFTNNGTITGSGAVVLEVGRSGGGRMVHNGQVLVDGPFTRLDLGGRIIGGVGLLRRSNGATARLVGATIEGGVIEVADRLPLPVDSAEFVGATIASPLRIDGSASVTGAGIKLRDNTRIDVNSGTSAGTGSGGLNFTGAAQSVTGHGEIVLNNGAMRIAAGAAGLTLDEGITVRTGRPEQWNRIDVVSRIGLVNRGKIIVAGAGHRLSIGDPDARYGEPTRLTNAGTIRADLGGRLSIATFPLNFNPERSTLSGGEWICGPGSTLPIFGVRRIDAGTTVRLTGPIAGPVFPELAVVAGTLSLAGGLTIAPAPLDGMFVNKGRVELDAGTRFALSGNYVQGEDGVLRVVLSGPDGSAAAPITATGAATVGGSLELARRPTYFPQLGDVAPLLSATSVAGAFDQICADTVGFIARYTGNSIEAVANPAGLLLPSVSNQSQGGSVCRDVEVVLSVAPIAGGTELFWQRETSPGSGRFIDLDDGSTIGWDGNFPGIGGSVRGSRTTTMTLAPDRAAGAVLGPAHARAYRAVARNQCGAVEGQPLVLEIRNCACSPADIASIGGFPPPDGELTVDDYTAFINAFAGDDLLADIASIGGFPPPDGELTVDDYTTFINAFAAGCG